MSIFFVLSFVSSVLFTCIIQHEPIHPNFYLFLFMSHFSQYAAYRAEKRQTGYSEEELEESFGFWLLDDISRVHACHTKHRHGPVFKPS